MAGRSGRVAMASLPGLVARGSSKDGTGEGQDRGVLVKQKGLPRTSSPFTIRAKSKWGSSLNALGWTRGRCSRSSYRYLATIISGTFFSSFLELSVFPFFAGFAAAMFFFLQEFCVSWFAVSYCNPCAKPEVSAESRGGLQPQDLREQGSDLRSSAIPPKLFIQRNR
jgi:hypothetical protein